MPKQMMLLTFSFQVLKQMPDVDEDPEAYMEDRGNFTAKLEVDMVKSCKDNGGLLMCLDSTTEDFYE